MTFGEWRNLYNYESLLDLLLVDINESYVCRGRYADNLEYDRLTMISIYW